VKPSARQILISETNNQGIDIDGILRGKFMSINKFKSAAKSSFGFCSVIFGWDGFSDKTYFRELTISNRENGYGDINAVVDWATYRRLPWEKDSPFFLVSFKDPKTGKPLHACPRSTLELVMKRIRSETGDEWEGMAGAEFEVGLGDTTTLLKLRLSVRSSSGQYFQFKETAQSAADKNFANLIPQTPGSESPAHTCCPKTDDVTYFAVHGYSMLRPTLNQDYFHELYDAAEAFGIEVEGHRE
jgi:glutamine synthetase